MSIYVLLEYVDECKTSYINPTWKGLFEFKKLWRD
ncbi:hypothetical protein CLLU_14800 [Clostridium luticellarii]|uniref:Uncharacterized protein n=1 Tax=Clostridium luticellarii TaxID=1691940 RepID=A0A2T0BNV1_9CLOT|nr:hypothetical protein CLLU_14800 [Clostridium luticellarii]